MRKDDDADTAGKGKPDPAPTGAEKGLAEARRRYGKQGGSEGTAPDDGADKGLAEALRRYGPQPPRDAA